MKQDHFSIQTVSSALITGGHTVMCINGSVTPDRVPPGLFLYDSVPGPDMSTLRFRPHSSAAPLLSPALASETPLPLDSEGVYTATDWAHIAPEPFAAWLHKLVGQDRLLVDAYARYFLLPDDQQRTTPVPERPNYVRYVVLPVFRRLSALLPPDLKLTIPRPRLCALDGGAYKIRINGHLVGAIGPSFDRSSVLRFSVPGTHDSVSPQYPVESMEQLLRLVVGQYRSSIPLR